MERLMVDVRAVEHGFGRNTSDFQARPTKSTTLLYYMCGLNEKKS